MKVFVGGTKRIKTEDGSWQLPECVCECLNGLIAGRNEILVDDQKGVSGLVQDFLKAAKYKNVTVCVAGSKSWCEYNAGNWPKKYYPVHGETKSYRFAIEKDFGMAEEADCGRFVWDGEDYLTFVDMLYLAVLGKKSKVYLININRWNDINSVEDLFELKGPDESLKTSEICKVLKKCGFSKEMIDCIVSENAMNIRKLVQVICKAPISLTEKKILLLDLGRKQNLKISVFENVVENLEHGLSIKAIKHDIREISDRKLYCYGGEDSVWQNIWDRVWAIHDAEDFLRNSNYNLPFLRCKNKMIRLEREGGNPDGFAHCDKQLFLFSEWYDLDELRYKEAPQGLFSDPEMVKNYIQKEESDNDTGEGFYRLEAWDEHDYNRENPRYDYYYDCTGEICWFNKLYPDESEVGNRYYIKGKSEFMMGGFYDLNLQTPYRTGDIVLIDCRPFGPPFHAMILESTHQYDSCFPTIVFRVPGTEDWRLTPLKHRRFYKGADASFFEPVLSPLYRLRKVKEDEIAEEDIKLIKLSGMIAGSEEKAAEVWRKWERNYSEDMKWEKVKRIFESIKE